jgi:hypothetical protein
MGRETKLLLGLLATLLGVFLGVLSMKLLVPRPPVGTGPDIHTEVAAADSHDLVEPPQFPTDPPPAPPPVAVATPPARFAAAPPRETAPRDPFVARASFDASADMPPPESTPAPAAASNPRLSGPSRPSAALSPPPTPGTAYVARPGDSWWSLAETVYGDGRLYRAVFAWNRAIDARVSLVPGTALELPPRDRLEAAWPALMPTR